MDEVNHSAANATTGATTDIGLQGSWVRFLPRTVWPYALLSRWDRPIGVWLMLLPGLWGLFYGAPSWPLALHLALFFIGGWVMRGAGCTINDILDRKLDGSVARTATRPLASGMATVRAAWVWLFAQLFAGLLILLQLPLAAQIFGWCAVPLILVYPLMKRITWWPQAWLGMTFNWGIFIGAATYGAHTDLALLPLYLGAICWTIGYDTIYAVQDRDDDRAVGIRSTALLAGNRPRAFVQSFYAVALLLWLGFGALASLSAAYFMGWAVALALCIWLLKGWQVGDMLSARRAFVRNQYVGLAMLAAIIAGKIL